MTKPTGTSVDVPPSKAVFRLTFRVPWIDETVKEWWDMQLDPSGSLRSLIRAEVERNGLTDTLSRPVSQQPRRGRPPMSAEPTRSEAPKTATATPAASAATPASIAEPSEPTPTAPAPQAGETTSSGSQLDMDQVFGARN